MSNGAGEHGVVEVRLRDPVTDAFARLEEQGGIGAGGTAEVVRCVDDNLGCRVALKRLRDELAERATYRAILIAEAQKTAQLDHPNIVPVHELGLDREGRLYFTMKLVRGQSLTQILEERPPGQRSRHDLYALIQVVLKVCDALSYAHSRGVIHRDLKPDNVMVGEYGEVYLMDWGIAKLRDPRQIRSDSEQPGTGAGRHEYPFVQEQGGVATGSPFYMAPEQAAGRNSELDARTDVFGVGAILYEIVTGRAPHEAQSSNVDVCLALAVACDIGRPEQYAPYLHSRLGDIICRAVQKEPSARYQSIRELKSDLESFLECGWLFDRRTLMPGTLIIREGDVADELYIIVSGHCRARKTEAGRQVVLRTMSTGAVFGEIAMFTGEKRTASVEALDEVTVMVLRKDDLERDLKFGPWSSALVKSMADRFVERDRQVRAYARLMRHFAVHGQRSKDGRWIAPWSVVRDEIVRDLPAPDETGPLDAERKDELAMGKLETWFGPLEPGTAPREYHTGPVGIALDRDEIWVVQA